MKKTYYFMAGLPRSGSSLLSAILNQNPEFYCGASSPVLPTINLFDEMIPNLELYKANPKQHFIDDTAHSLLDNFYSDINKPIVFDKNRAWTGHVKHIKNYLQIENPKIIVTVRNIDEILTSFLDLLHRNNNDNNFIDKTIRKLNKPVNDTTRCYSIGGGNGPLGIEYERLKQAYADGFFQYFHIVEYKDLVKNPDQTMKKIYDFVGQPYFQHNFNNIQKAVSEDDGGVYGLPDMHEVRPAVKLKSKKPHKVLPKEIFQSVQGMEFWRNIK